MQLFQMTKKIIHMLTKPPADGPPPLNPFRISVHAGCAFCRAGKERPFLFDNDACAAGLGSAALSCYRGMLARFLSIWVSPSQASILSDPLCLAWCLSLNLFPEFFGFGVLWRRRTSLGTRLCIWACSTSLGDKQRVPRPLPKYLIPWSRLLH